MKKIVILVITILSTSFVLSAGTVSAVSPDWMSTQLWTEDFNIPQKDSDYCSSQNRVFRSTQYNVNVSPCLIGNDNWSVGRIGFADLARDLTYQSSVVSLDAAHDDTLYTVLPDIFTLYGTTERWYPIGGMNDVIYLSQSGELYRYNSMPSKFHQNNASNKLDGFTFDRDGYDFHLTRPNGTAINIATFSISNNKEWATMNARGVGVIVMDLKTGATRRILSLTTEDWQDIDGDNTGLAISDDGKYVARFTPTDQMIIDTSDTCGDIITDDVIESQPLTKPCQTREVGGYMRSYQDYSRYSDLSFDADMRWLDLTVGSAGIVAGPARFSDSGERYNRIRVTTEEYVEPLEYLALGDSYSSGEGDVADGPIYYVPGTEQKYGCHLSSRSYPYLLRDHYQISELSMASVACSGAVVKDDYYSQLDGYKGQGNRLEKESDNNREKIQQASQADFMPGNVPQLEFVKKYRPDIVTLTGGGNDVGFAKVLQYCASTTYRNYGPTIIKVDDTCEYASRGTKLNKELYASVDTQYKYNREMIEKIQQYSPGTRVIIIGYPKFVDKDRGNCNLAGGFLDPYERKMIDDAVVYMNKMLLRVANDAGASFVDITDSLKGGRICEGSKYVTDLWALGKEKIEKNYFQEAFHPNAEGHKKMAQAIIDSDTLFADNNSFMGTNVEAFRMNTLSPSSDYEPSSDGSTAFQTSLFDSDTIVKTRRTVEISSSSGIFEPGSAITVVANSETVTLGEFQATEDGRLSAIISTDLLPVGYHVITASGKAPDGHEVALYQFALIKETDDDDSYARSLGFGTESSDGSVVISGSGQENRGGVETPAQPKKVSVADEKNAGAPNDTRPVRTSTLNSSKKEVEGWLSLKSVSLYAIIIVISGGMIYGTAKQRRKT